MFRKRFSLFGHTGVPIVQLKSNSFLGFAKLGPKTFASGVLYSDSGNAKIPCFLVVTTLWSNQHFAHN